jgi:hypothetical protein
MSRMVKMHYSPRQKEKITESMTGFLALGLNLSFAASEAGCHEV